MSLEYFVNFDDLSSLVGVKLTPKDLETHNVQVHVLDESTGQHAKEGSISQCQKFINTINVPGLYSLQVNLVELAQAGLIDSAWLPNIPPHENVKVEAGRVLVTRSNDGWFIYYLDYPKSRKVLAITNDELCHKIDKIELLNYDELVYLFSGRERAILEAAYNQLIMMSVDPGNLLFERDRANYHMSAGSLHRNIEQTASIILQRLYNRTSS